MPRIISIARSNPTRSSVVRCSDTSGGTSVRAVSVAIRRSLLRGFCAPPGITGVVRRSVTGGISAAVRSLMSLRQTELGLTPKMVESIRWRRLRWRLRGAWQWPAFALLTVVDAVLAARLPFQGEGADAFGAVLFAGFANLFAVALVAPLAGFLLRRRRRDLPAFIARDYAGTGLLVFLTAALVAGGLAHHSALAAKRNERRAAFSAVHDYVVAGEPKFIPGLGAVDLRELEPHTYRACVYRPAERLPICFFVNTDQSPAGIKRDPDRHGN